MSAIDKENVSENVEIVPKKKTEYDYGKDLIEAAKNGNLKNVQIALENKAIIDHYSEEWTRGEGSKFTGPALYEAASGGHFEIVKYLIEKGANPYQPYGKPIPKDFVQECNGRRDIAEYLLDVMKSPEHLDKIDKDGYTPLGQCLKYSMYYNKAKYLIDIGADVCKMDKHGKRPLVYAVESYWGDKHEKSIIRIVRKLLKKGAGVSAVSALERALEIDRTEIAKILIETNSQIVNSFLSDGSTPLIKAIVDYNEEMITFLIKHGADPNLTDKNGNNPFDKSLELHSIQISKMLLSKIQNEEFLLKLKPKLLQQLAEDGQIEVYKFLMENNWNKDETDEDGKTSLALSAKHQHLILTEFLIENGADIDKAKEEIENLRKSDLDFEIFMQNHLSKDDIHRTWCLVPIMGQ